MKRVNGRLRCAFTLIELLVVIAIISVLAALLVPAVALASDCRDGCEAQSRNGQFRIVAMPAQGSVALRDARRQLAHLLLCAQQLGARERLRDARLPHARKALAQ